MTKSEFRWRPDGRPAVISHRGLDCDHQNVTIKENTAAAFRRAAMGGADWVETDVQLSADNVLVLHHNLQADDGNPVAALTAAQAERNGWARLAEVHASVVPALGFNLELKFGFRDFDTDALVDAVLDVVSIGENRQWAITSFDPSIPYAVRRRARLRDMNPPPTGWITERGWPYGKAVLAAVRSGSQIAVLHADDVLANLALPSDAPTLTEAKTLIEESGLSVMVWDATEDNTATLVERGVTGLGTDSVRGVCSALFQIHQRGQTQDQ